MTGERWLFGLTLFTALGCGLTAGVFFAFSSFIMSALARLPPAQGMAAMQSINITVIPSLFMVVFMATALASFVLAVLSLFRWHQPGAGLMLLGGLLYLVGAFIVTVAFNVPLNDALGAAKPDSPEGAALWAHFLGAWTVWNHVRTVASLAAAVSFSVALYQRAGA